MSTESASSSRLAAFALSCGLFAFLTGIGLWVCDRDWIRSVRFDTPDIAPLEGQAFACALQLGVTNDEQQAFGSPIRLWEGERELGPAHMLEAFIAQGGKGSFRHEGKRVVFSSSDGSDPRTNGRAYSATFDVRTAAWISWCLACAALLAGICMWGCGAILPTLRRRPALQRCWSIACLLLLCLLGGEFTGRIALNRLFDERGQLARAMHDQAFAVGKSADIGWNSLQFRHHPYLIYSLNPDTYRLRPGEVNAEYLIRRAEPIRARDQVRLRILVLGGSTTHDSQIIEERDTWVFRLEERLRQELGPDVDVINGGVGGYTSYENLIHYVTMLTKLQPDMVLAYVGINDVHPRLYPRMRPDYLHYNQGERIDQLTLQREEDGRRWFALYRYARVSHRVQETADRGVGMVRTPYPPLDEWARNLEANPPTLFADSLRNLLLLAKAQGRQTAVIPQYFLPRNETDRVFAVGVEQNNVAVQEVARSLDVPILHSPTQSGTFVPDDTNDSCHFNHIGARKMAEAIYHDLAAVGWVPASPAGATSVARRPADEPSPPRPQR